MILLTSHRPHTRDDESKRLPGSSHVLRGKGLRYAVLSALGAPRRPSFFSSLFLRFLCVVVLCCARRRVRWVIVCVTVCTYMDPGPEFARAKSRHTQRGSGEEVIGE